MKKQKPTEKVAKKPVKAESSSEEKDESDEEVICTDLVLKSNFILYFLSNLYKL